MLHNTKTFKHPPRLHDVHADTRTSSSEGRLEQDKPLHQNLILADRLRLVKDYARGVRCGMSCNEAYICGGHGNKSLGGAC